MFRAGGKVRMESEPESAGEGSSQRELATDKPQEDGKREEGKEAGKLNSLRVNQLSRFLRHQQEVVYR